MTDKIDGVVVFVSDVLYTGLCWDCVTDVLYSIMLVLCDSCTLRYGVTDVLYSIVLVLCE